MFSIILWCLLAYFVYRFVVGFLIPVIRVTRQVKRQVNDFKQQAQQAYSTQQDAFHQQRSQNTQESKPQQPAPGKGDYIDFEEVADRG